MADGKAHHAYLSAAESAQPGLGSDPQHDTGIQHVTLLTAADLPNPLICREIKVRPSLPESQAAEESAGAVVLPRAKLKDKFV